ncbi:MAG: TonB-dependent receptor [Pyrinomonadaceae bacterium]
MCSTGTGSPTPLTFKLDEEGRYTFTPLVQWARQNRPAGGGIVISPSTSLATNDGVSGPVKTSDLSLPDVNLSAGGRIDRTVLTGFDFRANPADAWRINGSYRYINFGTEIDRFTPQVSSAAQLNQLRTENAVQRVQSKSEIERRYHNFDVNATYEMRQAGWWKNITQVGVHQRLAETRSTIAAGAVPGPQSAINIYTGRATSPLIANFPALIWGNLSEINFLNGYVQNRTSLADGRWVVTLGLGYGRNTVDGETRQGDLTPNAALVFNVNKRLALYTSYATSYNPNDVDAEDASGRRGRLRPDTRCEL